MQQETTPLKINFEINVGENPAVDLISRLFSTAIALDQPAIIRQVRVGDISHTEYPAQTQPETQTLFQAVADSGDYHAMVETAEQAGEGDVDADEGDTATDQPAVPGAPAKKKGRKSNAQKAAEAAAAEAAAAALVAGAKASVAPPVETPAITLPPGAGGNVTSIAPAGGVTLPPGVTLFQPPVQQVQQPAQQVQQPTPAAMPTVPPGGQPVAGVISLEDFRAAYQQINTAKPGKPFAVLKATAWPDGTPKPGWFTAEAVPAEFRERLLEVWSMLA
jgi:hypothetical protein